MQETLQQQEQEANNKAEACRLAFEEASASDAQAEARHAERIRQPGGRSSSWAAVYSCLAAFLSWAIGWTRR